MNSTPLTEEEQANALALDVAQIGMAMDEAINRMTALEEQRLIRTFSKKYGVEGGDVKPTTGTAAEIMGMLSCSIHLADWLLDYLYQYENQTFDENTVVALTTARRAQGHIDSLYTKSDAIQTELRRLIVNNRCRNEGVEYLNQLSRVSKLAEEYDEGESEE